MLVKEQSALFVFNEKSHLQGIVHYDPKLKNVHQRILDEWNLGSVESTSSVDKLEENSFDEGAYDAAKIEVRIVDDMLDDDDNNEELIFLKEEDE